MNMLRTRVTNLEKGTRKNNSSEVDNSVHQSESYWMENILALKKSNQIETKAFDYRSVISEAAANVSKQSIEVCRNN
jgi:hypothetical protein